MAKTTATKKRKVEVDFMGQAHISSSFNNIIITLTNNKGDAICSCSAGQMGFKGSKKNTPYAAQRTAEKVAEEGFNAGLRKVDVIINGCGIGRESAIRSLSKVISVVSITDRTPLPHNGCRPPKRRRA
ncbi:30S ribosomal protein S11 [Bacteroidetes bacterium endosymbiont of Geopemphigus sp.]|uniref:30S ribosomal protein S11 n=1 Tax=Bacteroidetes bacterium endosymbiont of Geopemphigus sp. TaxID=2047937 RepID=UPI000CD10863|nr:30S ribosomal protein S11 [Bacteroidetes bacterium endosymbiont of Geopemphigus sp.]